VKGGGGEEVRRRKSEGLGWGVGGRGRRAWGGGKNKEERVKTK